MDTLARTIRSMEIGTSDAARAANGIEDLYNDTLDVIVARNAFPREPIAAAGDELDRTDRDPGWARPNEKMPVEDIQILGTHTPGTPTYQAPRGASLDAYLDSAERHRAEAQAVFPTGFDPVKEIERVLGRFSGGRPVVLPRAADGRSYAPLTLRRLADGKQIGIHHDYHYPLDLYTELKPQVDTSNAGELGRDASQADHGWRTVRVRRHSGYAQRAEDAQRVPVRPGKDRAAVRCRQLQMDVGDLFLLASGRCLHRVNRIGGPESRVTMGGFLALNKDRSTVLYWS